MLRITKHPIAKHPIAKHPIAKRFIPAFLMLLLCLFCVSTTQAQNESPSTASAKPNVVFFYIDDLGFSDVGFMGAEHYKTPNIDALADRGMIFTSAYAAAPNCAPSRACLMSGQYGPRHGIYTVGNPDRGQSKDRRLIPIANETTLPAETVTIGELFQKAKYRTGYFGKWHLGEPGETGPQEQGFHVNVGGNHTGHPKAGYFAPYKNPQLPDPQSIEKGKGNDKQDTSQNREYLTERLTKEAVQFINDNHKDPFLLFFAHYAVHTPIQVRPAAEASYKDAAQLHGFQAKYAAMVESVDDSVGQVIKRLKELQLDDNTVIVFCSDNGGMGKVTSCAPLRGSKGMCYEGGIRVPLSITWPGQIAAKSKCDVPVHGVDFFATFRQMLQVESATDQPMDGVDIMPLLSGKVATLDRPALFWHFPAYLQGKNYTGANDNLFRARPFSAIRSGEWKLIQFFEDQRIELYNLNEDLGETNNTAEKETAIRDRLLKQLKDWQREIEAPIPTEKNLDFEG